MSIERDIDLVNDLLARPSETSWVEFKKDNTDPTMIGIRCSALSNAARIAGEDFAYMLWGVEDDTHNIIGSGFDADIDKIGNQPLQLWLAQRLKPSIAFLFRVVPCPEGRVVLLEVPAATSAPVAFMEIPYIRIGSTTPKLMDYPDRYQQLIEAMRPYTWEYGIVSQYVTGDDVLQLLDYTQYFRLTGQPLPDNRSGIFERLEADRLIRQDVGEKWSITNLGAILFATDLHQFDPALSRKAVRFIAYKGTTRAATVIYRYDAGLGYACGFEGLINYINGLLPRNEHIGEALRETHPLFPELAIRELVANALIHQDMTIRGAGPQIELFEDRIEITNPGRPLVHVDRMIDLPPRSRNEALAALMRRMGMCEEQGSGLDKVVSLVEVFQLPPPLFRDEDASMQAILYGPRTLAKMSVDERIRACYQHAVLQFLSGDRMKNASLCERFGIEKRNAAQATSILNKTLEAGIIKYADLEHPRAGYIPIWA